MLKRLISLNLAIILVLTMLLPTASAANRTIIDSGTCGDNLTWTLYSDGELVIDGTGEMADYTRYTVPWISYRYNIQTVTVKNGVTRIGHNAFASSANLTVVKIPSSVSSIGDESFWNCYNLTSITVDAGNSTYSSMSGVLFNKEGTRLITCPEGKSGTYSVPSGVTEIAPDAFARCSLGSFRP